MKLYLQINRFIYLFFIKIKGKVNPSDQLIADNQPVDLSYEPVYPANITFSSPNLESNATKICQGNPACLYDVALTGSLSVGSASQAIDQQNTIDKESLGKYSIYFI